MLRGAMMLRNKRYKPSRDPQLLTGLLCAACCGECGLGPGLRIRGPLAKCRETIRDMSLYGPGP